MSRQISIKQLKRNISEWVNEAAHAGVRIVITFRGKPKMALVSMADYERLAKIQPKQIDIQVWLVQTQKISDKILKRRSKVVDVDRLLHQSRSDLEAR